MFTFSLLDEKTDFVQIWFKKIKTIHCTFWGKFGPKKSKQLLYDKYWCLDLFKYAEFGEDVHLAYF